MKDCNCNICIGNLPHRFCLRYHGTYPQVTKSNEMRSDSPSSFQTYGAWTQTIPDQIYCLFSLQCIWYCCNISLEYWKNYPFRDYFVSDDISHRDSRKSEKKIIPPNSGIILIYQTSLILFSNSQLSRNYRDTLLEHFDNRYSMRVPIHHK